MKYKKPHLLLFILLMFNCILLGQDQTAITTGPENGHLIIVGGNMSDPAIYGKFMELAGGTDAYFVVIVTAGTDEFLIDQDGVAKIEKKFREHGFNNITILHTRDPQVANSDEFIKPIKEATGLWFTGGRQWRLVDAYANTRTYDEIMTLLNRGGAVGGSSAGASIQGSLLVRGDTKTNTIMMGDHPDGFNFLTNCAIDQHLLALNRQFDLFEVRKAHPGLLGIGLDENTAIVVHHDEFEVIGKSFVAIYDGTFCQFVRDKDDWSVEVPEITVLPEGSERFYLLGSGRKYSLTQRRVIE